jgi:hypothetical protein
MNSPLDNFKIIEMGGHPGSLSEKALQALNGTQSKAEKSQHFEFDTDSAKMMVRMMQEIQPMLFEECYVKSFDHIRSR